MRTRCSSVEAATVLLAGAFILLGYAAWRGFFTHSLDSGTTIMWLAALLAGSCFGAMGVRDIGSVVLTTPESEPWYARNGATFFVPVAVGITGVVLGMAYALGQGTPHRQALALGPTTSIAASGMMTIWIVLLDWPNFGAFLTERRTPVRKKQRPSNLRTSQATPHIADTALNRKRSDDRPYLDKRNR